MQFFISIKNFIFKQLFKVNVAIRGINILLSWNKCVERFFFSGVTLQVCQYYPQNVYFHAKSINRRNIITTILDAFSLTKNSKMKKYFGVLNFLYSYMEYKKKALKNIYVALNF